MSVSSPAVQMRDVRKSYNTPGGRIHAVDAMTLHAEPHRIHAFLGPNGAGKTTSLEMIVGLRRADQGRVRTLGLDPATARRELSTRVAIQPQEAKVFERLRVGEIMTLWSSFYSDPHPMEEILDSLELTKYLDREVTKLSGGTRQRLNVALAMVAKPELLVLDEPSTGLDPRARERLWAVLASWRDQGLTIVMSTHSMEEATALADSVFIIDRGRCVSSGAPDELIRKHVGGPAVHFQIVRDLDGADMDRLNELGELIIDSNRSGRLVTAHTDEALAVLAADGNCRDLKIQVPTLADAYFAATGNQLTAPEPAGE